MNSYFTKFLFSTLLLLFATPLFTQKITLSGDPGAPAVVKDYFNDAFFRLNGIPYEGSQAAQYDDYKRKYENGVGNIIQDKWGDANYEPILERALYDYIAKKFPKKYPASNMHLVEYIRAQIQNKDKNCTYCQLIRYEYVGFFVPEYLKVLRTGASPVLSKQFGEYVSYHLAKGNRHTLESWKYYSRSTTAELNDTPFIPGLQFNDDASLIDRDDIEPVVYDETGRGKFIKSGIPLRDKTVSEFKSLGMNGSPMYFTHRQDMIIQDYAIPLVSQSFPDDPIAKKYLSIPNYLSQNLSVEAQALNMVSIHAQRAGISFATGATVLFGAHALHAFSIALAKASGIFVTNVIPPTAAALAATGGTATASTVTTTATIESAALGANAIGPALSSAIWPVAIGVGVFMVGFMPTGGKAIEVAIFENSLKDGCYIRPRNENWMTMSDQEKIENFSFLFKMLVLDPRDFTYAVPESTADVNEQRRIEMAAAESLLTVEQRLFHGSLGFEVIKSMNDRYGIIASTSPSGFIRIQNNWHKDNYIHNQNGTIEQGVIQPNWWSSQWKIVPAHSGLVRIQNKWKPTQFLHYENRKLEVGPIQPNWTSAMWKLAPEPNGWVRIQNSWVKDHYIHNQNGKLEVGPIQPGWTSALWKLDFSRVSTTATVVTTPPVVTPPVVTTPPTTAPPSTGVAVGTATITDAPAPTVLPPAAPGFVRIQSKSTPDNYIHHQNTKPEAGQIQASWLSGQWKVVYYAGGWVNYESRLKPGHYLNNNEGKLEVVKIARNRSSALWKSLRIQGDWVAIENSYSSNHFLHTKNGKIEIGEVQPSSSSALWKVK
ncbi:RICIN domain-containing protein [Neolewinella persica]|uniref:RICIN domain-containing protein n=1 Tax=Neolewinella persica TaxID=70998 RepID=UPI000369D40E|nr:hypothetical protein [Neolewinella persica]